LDGPMTVDHKKNCINRYTVKKYLTPNLQPFRALFFLFIFISGYHSSSAQKNEIDSLTRWINTNPPNDSLKIYKLHHLSYLLTSSDVDKSFAYYQRVSFLSDSLHFTYGKALAGINLGILLSKEGNFQSSNKSYFNVIDLAKSCGALRLEAIALNNIGENFSYLRDYEKSRQYARQAIDLNITLKAWRGVAYNYELIQRSELEQGRYEDARNSLNTGMPFAMLTGLDYVLFPFYLGYGKIQAIYGRYDSARYYFDKALLIAESSENTSDQIEGYLTIEKYMKLLPVSEKKALLYKSLRMAEKTNSSEEMAKAADQLSSVYDELKNKDSSIFYYRMFRSIRDSLYSENVRQDVIVNEAQWAMKKKELENAALKEITTAQKKQIAFKNILLLLGSVGFFLALVIAVLLYKSFQTKKLRNESQYKHKIAETEMQALQAQMNPHFFFNSLNSIENFIMQNEKKLASDYLNKFARFIRSILDSSNNDLIELNKDIESLQLYIDLERLRFNNKFAYFCKVDPQLLHGEFHVPALLVQPFLENAINHGIGPSERKDLKICLKVKLQNNMIHYIIEDNGIGREQSSVYNHMNKPFHKSVGMKLTQDRINIFNQLADNTESVKIIDLYDDNNKAAGTRIEFAIKAVTNASAQSYIGR
jgi:tetratricopeptide (TPR) repeat protein